MTSKICPKCKKYLGIPIMAWPGDTVTLSLRIEGDTVNRKYWEVDRPSIVNVCQSCGYYEIEVGGGEYVAPRELGEESLHRLPE